MPHIVYCQVSGKKTSITDFRKAVVKELLRDRSDAISEEGGKTTKYFATSEDSVKAYVLQDRRFSKRRPQILPGLLQQKGSRRNS